jgi:hypothetical protein
VIRVPDFYCPIPAKVSAHSDDAERVVVDWLTDFSLAESEAQRLYFARSRFPNFPGRALPSARPDLLPLAGKEVMWLQSFDDVHSDEPTGGTSVDDFVVLLAKLTRVIEDPDAPLLRDNPWARALRDLRLSIGKAATPAQTDRWVQAHIDYFQGLLWEAVQRTRGHMPGVDDYVNMWLKQSGVLPCIVFTDIACGYELPADLWADPRVRRLREMVTVIIGWDNDLTSYDKEVHRAVERGLPAVENLVAVVAAERGCVVDEAVRVVGVMRDRAMRLFVRLRDDLAAENAELARYAHGLGQWIRAYLDYSGRSPRYTDPTNPDDAMVSARRPEGWRITAVEPPVDEAALPALPSISSWWE